MKKTHGYASFRLVSDEYFDRNKITSELEVEPTFSWSKGEERTNSNQKYTFSSWGWSTPEQEIVDYAIIFEQIFSIIREKEVLFSRIAFENNAEWQIPCCIYIVEENSPGIVISPDYMKIAININASIDIDIYTL